MAYGEREDNAFFAALKSGAAKGAYYLYGAEEYLLERAVERAVALLDPGVKDMNLTLLRAPTAARVIDACETLPFFDERRVVLVRELAAEEGAALAPYVGKTPETALLLIVQRGAGRDNALLSAMKKASRAVAFLPYDESLAVQFIGKRAKAACVSIDRATAAALVRMLGTDLLALETALSKLAAYAGYGSPVTAETLRAVVTPNVEYKIFSVLDKLVAGNKKAGLTELYGLMRGGEGAMGLAAFLEGRVRLMLRARQLLDRGMGEPAIKKALGGSPYAAEMTIKNARRMSAARLISALTALTSVDALQKQGRARDTDSLLLAVMRSF